MQAVCMKEYSRELWALSVNKVRVHSKMFRCTRNASHRITNIPAVNCCDLRSWRRRAANLKDHNMISSKIREEARFVDDVIAQAREKDGERRRGEKPAGKESLQDVKRVTTSLHQTSCVSEERISVNTRYKLPPFLLHQYYRRSQDRNHHHIIYHQGYSHTTSHVLISPDIRTSATTPIHWRTLFSNEPFYNVPRKRR